MRVFIVLVCILMFPIAGMAVQHLEWKVTPNLLKVWAGVDPSPRMSGTMGIEPTSILELSLR